MYVLHKMHRSCTDSSKLFLRWLFPFIGHMGICTSTGIIRDFAGPYFVSVSDAEAA